MSYITKKGIKIRHGLEGRLKNHLKSAYSNNSGCPKFYNSIVKFGINNFKSYILEICNLDELNEKETFYIKKFNTVNDGYNILYSNSNNIKNYDNKLDLITKISNTMKYKWLYDKEYIEKTTKNNLKAVIKRANNGSTRKNKNNLPPNIYKSEKGYDIRIMRNGIFKITSVENNSLSDQELLNKAIIKRNEILEQLENNNVINFKKKLDHNGNILPIGIYRKKARNQEAYAIKIIINKKSIEKCISNSKLSMDEKLDKAIKLFNELKILYKMDDPQVKV